MGKKQVKAKDRFIIPRSEVGLAMARRGGAGAGVHGDRRTRRLRTRTAQRSAAVRDAS